MNGEREYIGKYNMAQKYLIPVAGDRGDVQCAVYTALKEAIAHTLALHATRTSTRITKKCHLHIPTAVRRHCICI